MEDKGYTLIEVLTALIILSILAGIAVPSVFRQIMIAREKQASSQLAAFKMAMIGDTSRISEGKRTGFGYLGDWGSLPESLLNLINPKTPAWKFDSERRVGAGWNGRYIDVEPDDLVYNSWGDEYVYNTEDYVNESGVLVDGVITSYGEDRVPSDDDQKVEILKSETTADRVRGYVMNKNERPAANIEATINYPVNGSITGSSVITNNHGYYEFNDIPFGVRTLFFRTVGVDAIVYVKFSSITREEDLEFWIKSNVITDLTITWLKAEYVIQTTEAYYEMVKINGETVWDWDGVNRAGSGDIVYFDHPVTLKSKDNSIRLIVASSEVYVPDMINQIDMNAPVTFELLNFVDKTGHPYDMMREEITITFSDGSVITFIP